MKPVCGIDFKTYKNSCTAECSAGIKIAHAGPCQVGLTPDPGWLLQQGTSLFPAATFMLLVTESACPPATGTHARGFTFAGCLAHCRPRCASALRS